MEQKKYIDIENIRETDVVLNGEVTRFNNTKGFNPGDIISVTTKIDGSNASITFDIENNEIRCFSRNKELKGDNGLNGFKEYALALNPDIFKTRPNYTIFGEWMGNSNRQNKITYDRQFGWVVYSIWNKDTQHWLEQDIVKDFCNRNGFEYIEELYYGPFISWEHCKSFMHSSKYGPTQEGIVIRNITEILKNMNETEQGKLDYINGHHNFIIKIVNDAFKETMMKRPKVEDPNKKAAKEIATQMMSQVVTQNRIEKMISKMQDEGLLDKVLSEKSMKVIAQNLPKRIYADIQKEEPEILQAAGEYAGKICGSMTIAIARRLIIGE